MRHPVWGLNVGLTLLLVVLLGVLVLLRKRLPERKSLTPAVVTLTPKRVTPFDVQRIYENDLFLTYRKPIALTPPEEVVDMSLPPPPMPVMPQPIRKPEITFLEPLAITVKGIILGQNSADNRAILSDEKTKKEDMYEVGDAIEDAEILAIASNKVILLRANGQQEVVFLDHQEAATDPLYSRDIAWHDVVKPVTATSFIVDRDGLTEKIASLAQFLDMLDVTTFVERGISVGCQIGQLPPGSLGTLLGLRYRDIVTHINDMPTGTTENRVAVYQALQDSDTGSIIRVRILRQGRPIELRYTLQSLVEPEEEEEDDENVVIEPTSDFGEAELASEPTEILHAKRYRDRMAMEQYGGRASLIQ